jgi:hypothetical protein
MEEAVNPAAALFTAWLVWVMAMAAIKLLRLREDRQQLISA